MSLRARVLIGMAVVAVVLGLTALAVTRTTQQHLVDQVDEQLRTAGRPQLGGPWGQGGGPPQGEGGEGSGPRLSAFYVGLILADGTLQDLATPDVRGDDEEAPTPVLADDDVERLRAGETITVGSTDPSVDYRMDARTQGRGGQAEVVLALPLDGVQESVRRLLALELLAVLTVLAVLALVTWWVIRLGVRPLRRMTETAGAIAGGDLSRRIPEEEPGTEAGDLGVALNGMLGRIEGAFDERRRSEERLRRFVADASHELRTPVTTIRGYAELYRTGALAEDAALDEAMRRTEQEAIRMGTLVDDLLHLARLDQGRPLERAPVDLAAIARDAAADAAAVAPERDITVEAAEPVVVVGDDARLRQVVANLVTNALVHAPTAAIEVLARVEEGGGVLEVTDHGPGMAPEDAARAFERFYRADAARGRHQGGSGLGLAIVEATVAAHGGTATLTSGPGGTTVRVELPMSPPGTDGPELSC